MVNDEQLMGQSRAWGHDSGLHRFVIKCVIGQEFSSLVSPGSQYLEVLGMRRCQFLHFYSSE